MSAATGCGSVWEATGVRRPVDPTNRRTRLGRLPGGVVVERDLAQIIAVLGCNGVQVVDHGARGWGSPIAYLVLGTNADDLDTVGGLLGHRVDPDARVAVARALREPVAGPQAAGAWWPSGSGRWAVGAVTEMDGPHAALAWPARDTRTVEQAALDGLPRVRVRPLTIRQWVRRHPAVVPRRVWEQVQLAEDHPGRARTRRQMRRVRRENDAASALQQTHRRGDR